MHLKVAINKWLPLDIKHIHSQKNSVQCVSQTLITTGSNVQDNYQTVTSSSSIPPPSPPPYQPHSISDKHGEDTRKYKTRHQPDPNH